MILHLLSDSEWRRARALERYSPASLTAEGFVHCTGDDDTLLAVANRFYRDAAEPMVVLTIDERRLAAEVRWEAPAHPDGRSAADDEPRFPHVYGALELAAVVAVRSMVRDERGQFVAIT